MTDEERKEFEDRCTIKSKEMFIETCRKNGIPERSDETLEVLSISVECEPVTARVARPYPFIEIAEGWIYERDKKLYAGDFVRGGYDQYMGEYIYHKVTDIRRLITAVKVEFRKRKDRRDCTTGGSTKTSTTGEFVYPIPSELRDEIGRDIYGKLSYGKPPERKRFKELKGMELSSSVQKKMIPFLMEQLIEE